MSSKKTNIYVPKKLGILGKLGLNDCLAISMNPLYCPQRGLITTEFGKNFYSGVEREHSTLF